MNPPERTLQLLGLSVPSDRRARFLEEWRADLLAARAHGLSPWAIVVAALQVAVFLAWVRLKGEVRHGCSPAVLLALGCALGLVLVVIDFPVVLLIPVVVLALLQEGGHLLMAWIRAPR